MTTIVAPQHLGSMARIKEAFGVGSDRVKAWFAEGAPIAVEYDRKNNICEYSAEYNALQSWRVKREKRVSAA